LTPPGGMWCPHRTPGEGDAACPHDQETQMASITGITKMGMQLVAGDSRSCAGSGRSISAYRAWSGFAATANGTKPATQMLVDVPDTHRTRRPRSSQ
jgi:hypothetical protein